MELLPLDKALDYGISVVVILILAYLLWSVLESSKKREDMLMQLLVSIQPTQEGILIILKEMRDDVSRDHKEMKTSLAAVDEKIQPKKSWGL